VLLLEKLSLFDNKMRGQIPFNIAKLENLEKVNLAYNSFSDCVPAILTKKKLQSYNEK
jgi:hypothetical protein